MHPKKALKFIFCAKGVLVLPFIFNPSFKISFMENISIATNITNLQMCIQMMVGELPCDHQLYLFPHGKTMTSFKSGGRE